MNPNVFHSGSYFRDCLGGKNGIEHGTGYIKLTKLMHEVLVPEQMATLAGCRLRNASFKYMFHSSNFGTNRIQSIPPDRMTDWAFIVWCSRCRCPHEFLFRATENSLKDYIHMRGLTYG